MLALLTGKSSVVVLKRSPRVDTMSQIPLEAGQGQSLDQSMHMSKVHKLIMPSFIVKYISTQELMDQCVQKGLVLCLVKVGLTFQYRKKASLRASRSVDSSSALLDAPT